MKYCLTIDVSKGKSMVGLISEDVEILIDFHELEHNKSSLLELHTKVQSRNLGDSIHKIYPGYYLCKAAQFKLVGEII